MGALLTGTPRFAALRKTVRERERLPGKGDRFASNELKPVAAQRATRPIARSRRGAEGGHGGDCDEEDRAGGARGSPGKGQKTALTRRGFLVEGWS